MLGRHFTAYPMDLVYLVYVSAASKPFSEEELLELLEASRLHNEGKNITGLLLYCEGQFIQVLEGARSDVDSLFERICVDTRHKAVQKLMSNQSRRAVSPIGPWDLSGSKQRNSTISKASIPF